MAEHVAATPVQVHQADDQQIEQVASEGVSGGKVRFADDEDGAHSGAQLGQRGGRREHDDSDERPAQTRLVSDSVSRRDHKVSRQKYHSGGASELNPEKR